MPLQELEKLEVERIEWIQTHLRQYTTLRHETDMFNQSVSPPDPSDTRVFLLPEVLLLFSGGGTCGPAAAEGGSRKGPRAVGEGEQDRRGPPRGYGHIEPPGPGRAGPDLVSEHSDATCRDHTWIRPGSTWRICSSVFSPGERRQTSMFPRRHDLLPDPSQTQKSADPSLFSNTASPNESIFISCMKSLL